MSGTSNSGGGGNLVYTVVAAGAVPLVEYSPFRGTFSEIARRILTNWALTDVTKPKSYAYQGYVFHCVGDENGIIFMTLADESIGHTRPFIFLDDISKRFLGTYSTALKNPVTAQNPKNYEAFARVLKEQMEFFSANAQAGNQIEAVRAEVENVKQIMVTNIDKVLERGDRIELLVEQTEDLSSNSHQFKLKSERLKKAMCRRNLKWTIILAGGCAVVLIVVILAILFGTGILPPNN
ncbi:vesicle-associated membrane protein 714 [Pelomyxa schiedti]|nr:vesicle-associated membrane protein 714 [Pelomyxa schiedti]